MEFLKDWVGTIGGLFGVGAMIYSWLTANSRANSADLKNLKEAVAELKGKIDNTPSKDFVHELDKKVTELNGSINVVAESLKGVERTARRIEEYLLNKGDK